MQRKQRGRSLPDTPATPSPRCRPHALCVWIGAVALLAAVPGCGEPPSTRPIETVREIEASRLPPPIPDAMRLRVRTPRPKGQGPGGMPGHGTPGQGMPRQGASGHAGAGAPAQAPQRVPYTWTLPSGWMDKPIGPMQMRVGSFKTEGSPPGDVSVGVFQRSPLLMNVNRWRGQLGAKPIAEEDLAKSTINVAGGEGILVDVRGTYSGGGPMMGGGQPVDGQRLLGVLYLASDHLMSVRFLGTEAVVDDQEAAFHAFVASMEPNTAAAAPAAGPSTGTAANSPDRRERLRWDLPSGWTAQRAAQGMRIATFTPPGEAKLDVGLTVLAGTGGGAEANLEMWAGAAGRPPLSADERKALPRIDVLGGSAMLVDLRGARVPGADQPPEDVMLLALMAPSDGYTYFLKVQGREADLETHKVAFETLAKSLRFVAAEEDAR